MRYAELHNYLGIPTILGSDFQQVARAQVGEQGASVRDEEITDAGRRRPGRDDDRVGGLQGVEAVRLRPRAVHARPPRPATGL
jgi:hypothetical protein